MLLNKRTLPWFHSILQHMDQNEASNIPFNRPFLLINPKLHNPTLPFGPYGTLPPYAVSRLTYLWSGVNVKFRQLTTNSFRTPQTLSARERGPGGEIDDIILKRKSLNANTAIARNGNRLLSIVKGFHPSRPPPDKILFRRPRWFNSGSANTKSLDGFVLYCPRLKLFGKGFGAQHGLYSNL